MFLVAATLVVVVSGAVAANDADIDYGTATCCPKLLDSPGESDECTELLTSKPDCTTYQSKCLYNNRWYEHGETVSLVPDKCVRVFCEGPKSQGNGSSESSQQSIELATLKMESVYPGMNCCVSEDKLFPEGYKMTLNTEKCTRQVCSDGAWNIEVSSSACIEEFGRIFFQNETVSIRLDDEGCTEEWNNQGNISYRTIECCIQDNEVYRDGDIISLNTAECEKVECMGGVITFSTLARCCVEDGFMYANGDIMEGEFEKCRDKICYNGIMVEQPSDQCCKGLENEVYSPREVVLENLDKCILKVCGENGIIVDKSLPHCCFCCRMGDQLHRDGDELKISSCLTITCRNNHWERTFFDEECDTCYSFGDPHFETFDGTSYSFYGHCNYTLLQNGTGYTSAPSIYVQLRWCGENYQLNATCNGPLTVAHSPHVMVTVSIIGDVKVNGAEVQLPYTTSDKLVVWDDGDSISIITFNGFYIRYGKDSIVPDIAVMAPKGERDKGWMGLCGAYDGRAADDYTTRWGNVTEVANFSLSWNTGFSETTENCKDIFLPSLCNEAREDKIKAFCGLLLKIKPKECVSAMNFNNCMQDMCACREGYEMKCFMEIRWALENRCGFLDCPPDVSLKTDALNVSLT